MYPRMFIPPTGASKSFFIFGPRGTGKTTWIRNILKPDIYIDLLEDEIYTRLLGNPSRLTEYITKTRPNCIVIDEIQKIPPLTGEVHRLIEERKLKFVLTGSSARKLKRTQADLLAGRALTFSMFPLTARELGADFHLQDSLQWGHLPPVFYEKEKHKFLKSYVKTYLREELLQEGLIRNIEPFARFLESASFSQASVLNVTKVAKDIGRDPKVVEGYFGILEDLLIGNRLPAFSRRSNRKQIKRSKFYYFDVGIFRAIRPMGPLDDDRMLLGQALETLVFQELRALNEYLEWEYELSFWHTTAGQEVDFVLYGKRGLIGIEVIASSRYSSEDLKSLLLFKQTFPPAKLILLYTGDRRMNYEGIQIIPVAEFLQNAEQMLSGETSTAKGL